MAKLDAVAEERGFRRRWPVPEDTDRATVVASVMSEGSDQYQKEGLDLSASTDDRPFFFQTVALFGKVDPEYLATLSNNEHSVTLLRTLLELVGALTLALFFFPFAFARRIERSRELWLESGYFLAIGLGFMLVEVPWMQRFVLYLGHPSYATTVVLTSLLLGAGAGSFTASRVGARTIKTWGLLVPMILFTVNLALGKVFAATLGLPFAIRLVISSTMLLPAGFLMGFPFTVGMARASEEHKPWLWAINGAAGVLASVFAVALSIQLGFTRATNIGAACYLAAYLLLVGSKEGALQKGNDEMVRAS
jgi:hypothetical protein